MPKYKTKNDIPYIKFMEFSNDIAQHSEDAVYIADKVIEYFYPEVTQDHAMYVEEFSIALQKEKKRFIPYLISLKKLYRTDHFIDASIYSDTKAYAELFKIILRPLHWFGNVNTDKINLYQGTKIMSFFKNGSLKSKNLTLIFLGNNFNLQFKR